MKPFTSQEQELTTGLGLAVVVVVVSAFYALFSKGKGNGGGKRTGGTTTRTTTKERRSFFYRKSIDETFGLLQLLYDRKCFGGRQKRYSHESKVCNNRMVFSVFLPENYDDERVKKIPFVYCLTGLTTSDEYFPTSTGIQKWASFYGIALVFPDTSPRNTGVEDESETFEVGTAAGLYCDATEKKWSKWQMYSYVVKELPLVIKANFPKLDQSNCSLLGHSMGGCGCLQIYLKNSTKYKGCSCINAVTNPTNGVWGPKPLTAYLGDNPEAWKRFDPTECVERYSGKPVKIWIEQGSEDPYLNFDLLPYNFKEAADMKRNVEVKLTYREGYDHGFACVSSCIEGHMHYHAKILGKIRK